MRREGEEVRKDQADNDVECTDCSSPSANAALHIGTQRVLGSRWATSGAHRQ